jgi:uncharacterized protein
VTGTRKRRRSPNGPLVLDCRELGRRPGSMRRVRTRASAPPDLGTTMLEVPAGEAVELDLRLESVVEGVLVTGEVHAPVHGECSRCLEPFAGRVGVEFRELFYYPDRAEAVAAEDSDGDGPPHLVDDRVDLEASVRDALVLGLPLSPVCAPDCAGLCADCGVRLDEAGPGHAHDVVDPRWAALSSLIENKEKD